MILLLLSLLLFIVAATGDQQQQCVYTQAYWIDHPALVPQRLLCNTRWDQLMRWEVPQLQDTRQQVWLDAFHHACAAQCNLARLNQRQGEVVGQVALLLGLLERGCGNLTAWSLQWLYNVPFNALLDRVRAYSRGLAGVPSCADEFAPAPFSFANRSDLFMVVLPSNETVEAGSVYFGEALANAFQLKSLLIAFIALSIILTIIVTLMFFMLVRKRRITYHCCEPTDEDDAPNYTNINAGLNLSGDDEIDLSDLDPPRNSGGAVSGSINGDLPAELF